MHGHEVVPPFLTAVPFFLLLLCIAIGPLLRWRHIDHLWERIWVKLVVSLILSVPVVVWMVMHGEHTHVIKALMEEYFPFITLLFSLFCITGNISLTGDIKAKPYVNLLFLIAGTLLASLISTTGAALLLIRPLLNTNKERQYVAHTVIFFIFTVCNLGGALLPIGDPPLFMGLLRGVPFSWTLSLTPEWFFTCSMTLLCYFAVDTYYYSKEDLRRLTADAANIEKLRPHGLGHFLLIGGIVLAIVKLKSLDLYPEAGEPVRLIPYRELAMFACAGVSFALRNKKSLEVNCFNWDPIAEVAALFVGIFQTMQTALLLLKAHATSLRLNPVQFFVVAGSLSAFLDNAPTYVVFFDLAKTMGGEPGLVVKEGFISEANLVSISLGSVFCGALTYIGNGPNFMVKAIAEKNNVKMPGFFGYMAWSIPILGTILAMMTLIFIAKTETAHIIGWIMAAAITTFNTVVIMKFRRVRQRNELFFTETAANAVEVA